MNKKFYIIPVLIIIAVATFIYASHGNKIFAEIFSSSDYDINTDYLEQLFQQETEPSVATSTTALKVPILIYHSVHPYYEGESKIQDRFDITPELLDEQLTYIEKNGFQPISLDEFAREVKAGSTWPMNKPVVLTFDDGWENQYKYAFPVLKKHNISATFYIYSNPIGRSKHFLTWEQVKEMQDAGMYFESHTVTHPYLKGLSEIELRHQIIDSKKILEEKLGQKVNHFASPFGYTSPEVQNMIKEAGYTTGRTTYKGKYHTEVDLLKLKGYLVSDSIEDFKQILK